MPMMNGTAGGQDGARRAAMQYTGGPVSQISGGPAAAPQSDVGATLAMAVQQTAAAADKGAAIAAWKQALMMLREILNGAQSRAPMGGPPEPSPMSQMGAQAVSPMIGRAPR